MPKETRLQLARRHVIEGEARITRQEQRVEHLRDALGLAETVLSSFQDTIAVMRDDLALIEAERKRRPGANRS